MRTLLALAVGIMCALLTVAVLPVHAQEPPGLCAIGCQPGFFCARCDDRHKDDGGRSTCFDCATEMPALPGAVLACTTCRWNRVAHRMDGCSPCALVQVAP